MGRETFRIYGVLVLPCNIVDIQQRQLTINAVVYEMKIVWKFRHVLVYVVEIPLKSLLRYPVHTLVLYQNIPLRFSFYTKKGLILRSRILKIARTIADLEDKTNIRVDHIYEAVQYRNLDRGKTVF